MSQSNTTSMTAPKEKTFSSYDKEQGKQYAQIRRDYAPNVYQTVMNQHTSTGGQLDTLVDIGCGPGNAAIALASHFAHVIGLDPSEGMISTARSLGEATTTATSGAIRFEISTAEDLGKNLSPPIQDASVDLITAANAAHWFDMPQFWVSAARVLKPGGSVALWTSGDIRAHPAMPNAAAIQAAIEHHQEHDLKPYYEAGNLLVRNRYRSLPLPWTLDHAIKDFDESTFYRRDWDGEEDFFVGIPEADLDTWEMVMGTASAEVRWKQAHPDDVGTDRDVIKILRKKLEHLFHEAGVEKGKEMLKGTVHGTLLVIKKKA